MPDIQIRTDLRPGDMGHIIQRHGELYNKEYNYGIAFESYVAEGLSEFYKNYDPQKDRIWICESKEKIIGSLVLEHRGEDTAQLRYFLIEPEYRGIGLGSELMELFMEFFHQKGYKKSFLLTTRELKAASRLYLKAGFRLTEENESFAFGKKVIEQRYELSL